jgi:hypothetical protein
MMNLKLYIILHQIKKKVDKHASYKQKYKVIPIYIKLGNFVLYKNETLTILKSTAKHTHIFRHSDRYEYILPTAALKLKLEAY